jgi:hypothetical protein
MKLKTLVQQYKRKLLAPFDLRLRRAKLAAERFVVKTIAKHGLNTYTPSVLHVQQTQQVPSEAGSISVQVIEPSKLMLAYLKSIQRNDREPETTFQAVALGDGLVLVRHCYQQFMYADSGNVSLLPRLVIGDFEEETTLALEKSIRENGVVIHLGARQGYHMLTVAHLVGPDGRVVAFEASEDRRALQINVESHALQAQVTILDQESQICQHLHDLSLSNEEAIVFIEDETHLSWTIQNNLIHCLSSNPKTIVVDGKLVVTGEAYCEKLKRGITTEKPSALAA